MVNIYSLKILCEYCKQVNILHKENLTPLYQHILHEYMIYTDMKLEYKYNRVCIFLRN